VLTHLAGLGSPTVFIGFGRQAADALSAAGIAEAPAGDEAGGRIACILREHPARGDAVLALETLSSSPTAISSDGRPPGVLVNR